MKVQDIVISYTYEDPAMGASPYKLRLCYENNVSILYYAERNRSWVSSLSPSWTWEEDLIVSQIYNIYFDELLRKL